MSAIVGQGQGNLTALEIFGPGLQTPGLFIYKDTMTGKEIQELDQKIEKRNFVLNQELFSELIRAKLARLQLQHGVVESTTQLQKSQG
jgi:hypothetical protein